MKIIDTQNWESVPEKPGLIRVVSQRKAVEVFRELEEELRNADLYPDEYLLLDSDFDDEKIDFPEMRDLYCYAQWGNSEGIYLDVELIVYDRENNCCKRKHFATGKTLAEDSASFDRMQYIAGYIYRLFTGDLQTSARYIFVGKAEKNEQALQAKIHAEYREYLLRNLVHKQIDLTEAAQGIGLRSMIVHELPKCSLPEDKLEELLQSDNALDLLTKICEPFLDPDSFEINDMISSCDSFAAELGKRAKTDE